jgi:hypothetical protein
VEVAWMLDLYQAWVVGAGAAWHCVLLGQWPRLSVKKACFGCALVGVGEGYRA